MSYPRSLPNILDVADRAHLASIFREHQDQITNVRQRYYFLLAHATRRLPRHAHTLRIFEKVLAVVHARFGSNFMLLNDVRSRNLLSRMRPMRAELL